MTLFGSFLAVAGSVTGRDHRRAERDGQDGHAVVETPDVTAAIVTDGCSSGRASEIGARVGAAWLAALVEQRFASLGDAPAEDAAADVTRALLARLELLARSFDAGGAIRPSRVGDSLLFGFLAAVVTPASSIVFGIGDGIVVAGDRVTTIDPGPENAPPYLAYRLLVGADADAGACNDASAALRPRIHFAAATADVDVIAVATDGAAPLVAGAAAEADRPSLAALVADPRHAKNPSLLRKRLVVLSDRGVLSDDATVAVVRRRPA